MVIEQLDHGRTADRQADGTPELPGTRHRSVSGSNPAPNAAAAATALRKRSSQRLMARRDQQDPSGMESRVRHAR
jgi:hypothetical protein